MTDGEKESVKCLLKSGASATPAETPRRLSIGERALKRRKVCNIGASKRYTDTRFICPTSNVCERFFSVAGAAIGDLRRRVHTENIESQMFLHCNMDLWGVIDVNNALI